MFPGEQKSGGISVGEDGTLHLAASRRSHEGFFTCSAVSAAGSATHRLSLQVCTHNYNNITQLNTSKF